MSEKVNVVDIMEEIQADAAKRRMEYDSNPINRLKRVYRRVVTGLYRRIVTLPGLRGVLQRVKALLKR